MGNINKTISNADKMISEILNNFGNNDINIEHFNNVISSIHKELVNFNTSELLDFQNEIASLREKIILLNSKLVKEQEVIKKQLLELNKQKEGMSEYIYQNNMHHDKN